MSAPPEFCESFDIYMRGRRTDRRVKKASQAAAIARANRELAWKTLFEAAQKLGQPFGLTSLVLMAWAKNQKMFGLPGAEDAYPCSHRVQGLLYGPRGLLGRGLVRKLPGGLFEVVRGEEPTG